MGYDDPGRLEPSYWTDYAQTEFKGKYHSIRYIEKSWYINFGHLIYHIATK